MKKLLLAATAAILLASGAAQATTVTTKKEASACPSIGKLESIAMDTANGKITDHTDQRHHRPAAGPRH